MPFSKVTVLTSGPSYWFDPNQGIGAWAFEFFKGRTFMSITRRGALVGGLSTAMAQHRLNFRILRACADDVATLCSKVVPGGRRIKACMKENMSKLSAGCVDALLTAAAAVWERSETKPVLIPANPEEKTYTGLRGGIYCEVCNPASCGDFLSGGAGLLACRYLFELQPVLAG